MQSVHLHEDADSERVERLTSELRREGILRNPAVAASLPNGGYVILDGANRTTALRRLGAAAHLLQIVDYASPQIRLGVWHHLLREDGPALERLLPPDLLTDMHSRDELAAALSGGSVACGLISGARVRGVSSSGGLAERIGALRAVVAAYTGRLAIYRVLTDNLDELREEYDRIGALVLFPAFTKEQILTLAVLSDKLPTGITRHVIPHRALRVNVPLDLLRPPGSLEEKNAALGALIHERLLAHRVRVYPEPTVLFDD